MKKSTTYIYYSAFYFQQTLKNEIEMRINPATSTNMTNILPNSLQKNSNLDAQPTTIQFDLTGIQLNQTSTDSNQTINVHTTKENRSKGNQVLIDDKNLQCHMCNKREFTAESLKEHLKTHQGSREYECTYCLSKFCSSGGLSRHMKIHETPEYVTAIRFIYYLLFYCLLLKFTYSFMLK